MAGFKVEDRKKISVLKLANVGLNKIMELLSAHKKISRLEIVIGRRATINKLLQ